jgi:putative transposase
MHQGTNRRWSKPIRLPREHYEVPHQIVSITIGCRDRQPYFEMAELTVDCIIALRNAAKMRSIDVHAYCFMPDHVHLLLEPREGSNVIDFVQAYKSYTTKIAREHGFLQSIWQPRFYDHILREHEDQNKHIRYLIENPVRAGLVDLWPEYSYVGSFVYDLGDFDW